MPIETEAWFIYPHAIGQENKRAELVREPLTIADLAEDEVLAEPIYGSWEGNLKHAIEGRPVDVCRQRGEKRVVLGNAGALRVLEVGDAVTTVKPGQRAILFPAGVVDRFGYPKLIYGYDAPRTIGCFARRLKCGQYHVVPIPDDTRHSIDRWAAFSAKASTAWSNWELAHGALRLLLHHDELPAPHVWGWGGGTALSQLHLARLHGCKPVMMTSDERRADTIRRTGVTPLDRRPFQELSYDEQRVARDRAYRRRYMDAESVFLKTVREMTDGEMVHIFIDNIGTPVFRATLKALSREGILTTVGWGAGKEMSYLRASECIFRRQFVHTHFARYEQGVAAVAYAEANDWLPIVDDRYSYDEIPLVAERVFQGALGVNTVYSVNPE